MAKRKRTKSTKHPKLPNGFGRITEIKACTQNPFRAMKTIGRSEEGLPIGKVIGYYPTWDAAYGALYEYNQNPYELKKEIITIKDLYDKWSRGYFEELSGDSSRRTVESAWLYVTPEFRRLNAATIKPQMLLDYIKNDAKKIDESGKEIPASDNIKSRIKSMFNLMYDYAVLSDIIQTNPARLFSLKGIQKKIERNRKEKNPILPEHEQQLWDDIDFGYTRMILINIYSTWRPQELVILEKKDIDIDNMTMIGGIKTDAGYRRIVPIHPKIQDLVLYYYYKSKGKFLFYDYDGNKPTTMTYDKYRGRFEKIAIRHDWKDYSPSCPRHTFATRAKEAKMEPMALKLMMGHEISDVTEKHYTHIDEVKYLSEEILKLK